MSKFKIGDKVRCIRGTEANAELHCAVPLKTGEVFVVRDPGGEGNNPGIYLEGNHYGYYQDRFILVEQK